MAPPVILPPRLLRATSGLPALLRTCRAMGLGTIARHYGVTPTVALALIEHYGLRTTIITVEAVRNAPRTNGRYRIAYAGDRATQELDVVLDHYAGLAEMQLLIGGTSGQWNHAQATGDATALPDAYWKPLPTHPLYRRLSMEVGIEYDRGSYSPATRQRKLEDAILRRRPLVYGCPIPRRLLLVQKEVRQIHKTVRAQGRVTDMQRDLPVLVIPTYWYRGSEA